MTNWKKEVRTVRQWYGNGFAVAFVTIVNIIDGEVFDWAMYVGADSDCSSESQLQAFTAEYGHKVDRGLAHFLAPDLPINQYRD